MNTMQQIHTTSRVQRLRFVSFGEEVKPSEAAMETIEIEEKAVEQYQPVEQPELITEEELQAARNEGHQEGYKEGFSAAEAKVNQASMKLEEGVKSALDLIANHITLAAEEHTNYIKNKQKIMSNLVLGIARKVAGDAIKSEPYAGVEAVLSESLALIIGETKIVITVSENLCSGLKQRIDSLRPLLPGFNGELVVEGSTDMKDNNCRVEWKSGYAERDMTKLWNDIETIIARIGKI